MKKIYSFLTAALLTAFAASAKVDLPYTATAPEASPQEIVDNDNWTCKTTSGASWTKTVAGNTIINGSQWFGITGNNATDGQSDSWLVSPSFACKKSTQYKITFKIKKQLASNSLEHLDVYLTMLSPVNSVSNVISWYEEYAKQVDLSDVGQTPVEKTITIATDPTEQGDFYFALRAHGAHTGSFICVGEFKIEEVGGGEEPEPGVVVLQVPYQSTIAENGSKWQDGWKVLTVGGGKSWVPMYDTSLDGNRIPYAKYGYDGKLSANTFINSPAIHLEAGKEYVVSYGLKAGSQTYKENITLYATSSANTEEEILAGVKLDEHLDYFAAYTVFNISYTPTKTDNYHFCFHAHSDADKIGINVGNFKVVENVFIPNGVSNFTATADPTHALKVTLGWTLPTTSTLGSAFTEAQTVEKVEIYRDGGETPIATLDGPVTSYEDTEATGLTSGKHTYAIVVTVANVKSAAVNSNETYYVGPVEPVEIPAEFTIASQEDFVTLYTVVHGENSTVDYPSTTYGWTYGSYYKEVKYNPGTNKAEEDVIFFPPVAVSQPGFYRATLTCKVYNSQPYTYKYVIATTPKIDAMTVIGQAENIGMGYANHYFDFYVAEAGTYYLGVFANNAAQTNANQFYINKIEVNTSKLIPNAVSELTATADANKALSFTASWVNPTKTFAGTDLDKSQYKIEVYLGAQLYKTLEGAAITDGTQSLIVEVPEAGVYTVTVKTVGLDGGALETAPTAKTTWVGPIPNHECTAEYFTPYTSTIARDQDEWDYDWTSFNAGSGSEWKAVKGSSLQGNSNVYAYYQYSNSNPANTFVCSPAIHLEGGKEYVVMYGFRVSSSSNEENLSVYASTSVSTAEEITSGILVNQHLRYTNTNYVAYKITFAPELSGDYHFSFHAHSAANKYNIYLGNFAVVPNEFAPAGVSNFTATAAPARELKVSLAWTLPTKSFLGDDFTADQTIESVEIYRDGGETPIVTLGGDATSFEDTADTELTSGKHTYQAVVTVAGVKSEIVNSNETGYVGPIAPTPIPATFTLSSEEDFTTLYEIVKGENSTAAANAWRYYSSDKALQFVQARNAAEEDLIIFPPLAVEEAGYYRVSLSSRFATPSYTYTFKYMVGTEPTLEGMTVVGKAEGLTSDYTEQYFDFYAAIPGTYYVGVLANEPAKTNYNTASYYIKKIDVTKSSLIPSAVSDLTAAVAADGELSFTISWTNPTTSFAGGTITKDDYKVEVYLGEELYTTLEGDALVEGTQNLDVTVDAAGVYTVTVKAVGPEGDSAPKTPTIKTAWVGPKEVNLPYAVDFDNHASDPTVLFWDVLDGNHDGQTWKFYESTSTYDNSSYYVLNGFSTTATGKYEYNDYLFSPEMELTAGTYEVKFRLHGGRTGCDCKFTAGVVPVGEFNPEHDTWAYCEPFVINTQNASAVVDKVVTFTITETGKYKFVFASDVLYELAPYLQANTWPELRVFLFEIREIFAYPEIATDVTVTPDENFALAATIGWVNPAKNSFGQEMSMGDITKAIIYRGTSADNLEEIAEVSEIENLTPGAQALYVDNTVPAAGSYTYKVEIYNENGCSETPATVVTSLWIGTGTEIPADGGLGIGNGYDRGFTSGEWRVLNNNGMSSSDSFTLNANKIGFTAWNKIPDAWFISRDLFQFEKNALYEITVVSYCGGGYKEEEAASVMSLHIGGSDINTDGIIPADVEESFVKVSEWEIAKTELSSNKHIETIRVLGVKASDMVSPMSNEPTKPENDPEATDATKLLAGPARIAFNSKSIGDYYIDSIKLAVKRTYTGVDEIEAAANGVIFDGKAICFDGKASVHVYSMTGALVLADMDAVDTVSLEHLANGAYIVTVVPENGKAVTFKVVK